MQVEALAVALRKRSNWEAIDLGFGLARKWFKPLWFAWLLSALPIFLITSFFLLITNHWVFFTLFWWLKPLYEQPLLYILSRQTFSETVTFKDIRNNYFQIIKPQLLLLLTWRRLSFSRSFNNPVAMLEGLKGKQRRERLNVLHAQQIGTSQWLTITCVTLEAILNIAIIIFAYLLIPEEYQELTIIETLSSETTLMAMLDFATYFIATSIIAPFYVAAGFSLYITRRTKLEGWDIELAFKRLQNRLALNNNLHSHYSISLAVVIFLALQLFTAPYSYANNTSDNYEDTYRTSLNTIEANEIIEHVINKDDFGKTITKKEFVFIGEEQDEDDEFPEWLENFLEWLAEGFFKSLIESEKSAGLKVLEIIIWLGIGGLIIWLLLKYSHWLNWINTGTNKKTAAHTIPNHLFGMEISKESLPKDIIANVTKLFAQKNYRAALSLLYRASLSSILNQGDIEILDSTTEQECSNLVSNARDDNEAQYFTALTKAWVLLAYGNQIPQEATLLELRDNWAKFYGEQA